MALVNMEKYITPEMITISETSVDPESTYKYTDAQNDGKIYFTRYGKTVQVNMPVMKNLSSITQYTVATIPQGYRPKRSYKFRLSTGIASGQTGGETDEEAYVITFSYTGDIYIYSRQSGRTMNFTDSCFTYICA